MMTAIDLSSAAMRMVDGVHDDSHLSVKGGVRRSQYKCVVNSGIPNGVVGSIIQYHTCLVPPATLLIFALRVS